MEERNSGSIHEASSPPCRAIVFTETETWSITDKGRRGEDGGDSFSEKVWTGHRKASGKGLMPRNTASRA